MVGSGRVVSGAQTVGRVIAPIIVGDVEYLLDYDENISSVVSLEHCLAMRFRKHEIVEFLNNHPEVRVAMYDAMLEKLETTQALVIPSIDENFPFQYEFNTNIPNGCEEIRPEVQRQILSVAQQACTIVREINPEVSDDTLEFLFELICSRLEHQHYTNPAYYVSHGANHSFNTWRLAQSFSENVEMFNENVATTFGENGLGSLLMLLVTVMHDVGYSDLVMRTQYLEQMREQGRTEELINNKNGTIQTLQHRLDTVDLSDVEQEEIEYQIQLLEWEISFLRNGRIPKFNHQHFSGDFTRDTLPLNFLNRLGLDLTEGQYELFIEAIIHHGSDNPSDPDRPYIEAVNTNNPLLVIMRIVDNLDMINNRLSEIQRHTLYRQALYDMYYACNAVDDAQKEMERNRFIRERMNQWSEMIGEEITQEDYEQLVYLLDHSTWDAYMHIGSVAIANNIVIDQEANGDITVRVLFNKSEEELSQEIIQFQIERFAASLHSITLVNENGEPVNINIETSFPQAG
ncbi:hypothetical protein ACFL56_04020, partial [Candidatus Margulisiibacteriota bacterium]